jgi:serine/threonine protein kinase
MMYRRQIYTGKPPFPDLRDGDVLHSVLVKREHPEVPPNSNSQLVQLRSLIKKCWNRDPTSRPNASEIYEHLASSSPFECHGPVRGTPRLGSGFLWRPRRPWNLTKASVPVGATAATDEGGTVTANCTFIPSLPEELFIEAGDVVEILQEYDDGWALCVDAMGAEGRVPLSWLERDGYLL